MTKSAPRRANFAERIVARGGRRVMNQANDRDGDLARRGGRKVGVPRAAVPTVLRPADWVRMVLAPAALEGRCRRCGCSRNSIRTEMINSVATNLND
jgi:hypothetical protein